MEQQDRYGMDQLGLWLDMKIHRGEEKMEKLHEKVRNDYLYHFAWSGEELYKVHYMTGKYRELREVIRETQKPEEVSDYILQEREKCLRELVGGEIYTHYTNEIFNLAHSYKVECTQQLIQDYNGFGQLLSMKPPHKEVEMKKAPETGKKSNRLKI